MDKFSEIKGKIKASKAIQKTKSALFSLTATALAGISMVSCATPTTSSTLRVSYGGNGAPKYTQTTHTNYNPSRDFRNNMNSIRSGVNSLNSLMKTIDRLGR